MTKLTYLTLVLSSLAACGGDDGDSGLPVQNQAIVVSGDFQAGSPGVMSALDMETTLVAQGVAPTGAVGDDPIVRRFGDELFIVNRADGNNVTILDAVTLELVEQLATGAGSNPQDVAVVGNELYIPTFGTSGVTVVERGTGATRQIDLSSIDTADGLPDCNSIFKVGGEVFVACGRLESFVPGGNGVIAVIDTADDAFTTYELSTVNPFGYFEQLPGGDLVIPTVDFMDNSGCLQQVTPATGASSCLVDNTEVGGFISRVDLHDNEMYFVVASFGANGAVGNIQGLDLDAGELIPAVTPDTQVIVDFSFCPGNEMVVADATASAPGLRVYGEDGGEVTAAALPIGLAPGSAHGISCY